MTKLNRQHILAIITWAVVYPLITILLFILEPVMHGWPIPLRTLFLTVILVPIMVLWAMPKATKAYEKFLQKYSQERST